MNWFQRNQKKTIFTVSIILLLIGLGVFEIILSKFFGLGDPVLYRPYHMYGYRPQANQDVSRFNGTSIKINNLSLRANDNWDNNVENKILFLGDSVTYGGSYISNDELFSYLAVKDIPGYRSGNAGVNAWGIENIHGLIVNFKFLPAKVYVTLLLEDDIYRGLVDLPGLPFWCRKPDCALQEILYYFLDKITLSRYRSWQSFATAAELKMAYEYGVKHLKKLDEFLNSQGYYHLVYISPYREQVLKIQKKDKLLLSLFKKYNLKPYYLLDRIEKLNLSNKEIRALYHDFKHLSKQGHRLWGEMIKEDLLRILIEPDNN